MNVFFLSTKANIETAWSLTEEELDFLVKEGYNALQDKEIPEDIRKDIARALDKCFLRLDAEGRLEPAKPRRRWYHKYGR